MKHNPDGFKKEQEVDPPAAYVSPRHDGWTVVRQEAFLKALAACGCVTHACRAVGMSRESAYELRDRPAAVAFRRAWEAAVDCSMVQIEDGMVSRSIHGVPRPIFYKGEQVGEWRHFDERLGMFLLRYRRPHRYGSHLDRLPPPPLPPRPPSLDFEESDGDEAIANLDFHLDDLVDEAELPGGVSEASRADDGANFVNFVGFRAGEQLLPHARGGSGTKGGSGEDDGNPGQGLG
jgi:hypothetical protein